MNASDLARDPAVVGSPAPLPPSWVTPRADGSSGLDPGEAPVSAEAPAELGGPVASPGAASASAQEAPWPVIGGTPGSTGTSAVAPALAPGKVIPAGVPTRSVLETIQEYFRDYFLAEPPSFWVAMVPLLALSATLFTRHPQTNYIFDEQEALLANPYVNGKGDKILPWFDAFHRDFWGLPHERSVGSYRPIPDLIWRVLWHLSTSPWLHHWFNVLLHAANGACLVVLVHLLTKRRGLSWMAGAIFTGCAVLTEAVAGVVGIADVLGGLGAMLALLALTLPAWGMPFAVFAAVLFGLFSKESALVCVPLIPFAALLLAPVTHPDRPYRILRTVLASLGAVAAFVLYVELRKRWFPAPIDTSLTMPLEEGAPWYARAHHAFMEWFHQPVLPKDPLNNPLVKADTPHRIAGALRVYWRGLTQVVVPKTLSGDYSFPQEPVPDTLWFPESIAGAVMMVAPPIASLVIWVRSLLVEDRVRGEAEARGDRFEMPATEIGALLIGVGLTWIVISYFPHSNIPAVLPTVRAERFWYFPAIGSSMILAVLFVGLFHKTRHIQDGSIAVGLFTLFFTFQCGKAFQHRLDYRDDLAFWSATRDAVPNSAKAHLNYSVMWGARGRLDIRRDANARALELAPQWPMAHVYMGDTICRMHKPEEAWPYYESGFKLADNDPNLLSLGLQCMWDEQVLDDAGETVRSFKIHEVELTKMCDERPGTWLNYLVRDMTTSGETNNGVDPKYRPRGYNEGPKD